MKKARDWKHYYLTVGNGCITRSYFTVALSEAEARRDCTKWADSLALEGPVRLLRKKTNLEG